jgi:hypothetical protein
MPRACSCAAAAAAIGLVFGPLKRVESMPARPPHRLHRGGPRHRPGGRRGGGGTGRARRRSRRRPARWRAVPHPPTHPPTLPPTLPPTHPRGGQSVLLQARRARHTQYVGRRRHEAPRWKRRKRRRGRGRAGRWARGCVEWGGVSRARAAGGGAAPRCGHLSSAARAAGRRGEAGSAGQVWCCLRRLSSAVFAAAGGRGNRDRHCLWGDTAGHSGNMGAVGTAYSRRRWERGPRAAAHAQKGRSTARRAGPGGARARVHKGRGNRWGGTPPRAGRAAAQLPSHMPSLRSSASNSAAASLCCLLVYSVWRVGGGVGGGARAPAARSGRRRDARGAAGAQARGGKNRAARPVPSSPFPLLHPTPPPHLVVHPEPLVLVDGAPQHRNKLHILAAAQRREVPETVAAAQVALELAVLCKRVARADHLCVGGVRSGRVQGGPQAAEPRCARLTPSGRPPTCLPPSAFPPAERTGRLGTRDAPATTSHLHQARRQEVRAVQDGLL